MKNRYIKIPAEILGLQIFFAILSLLFLEFFSWLGESIWIFSLLTGWLLLGAIHSTFWQMGRKDSKNKTIENNHLTQGQNKSKLSMLGGLKVGSVFFVINVLIVLFTSIFSESSVLFTIHRILLGALCGFLPDVSDKSYWFVSVLLCIVMYIPCITAYITGAHNFSISEKIVPKLLYKSSDKKN